MKLSKHIFRMPTKPSIIGRSSSMTNAFIAAVMPYIVPTDVEVRDVLQRLGMDERNIHCAYCGGKHTEWDHLKPFVENRKPTGYYTCIRNLVPACGKCNQSKGNKNWHEWMRKKHSATEGFEGRFHRLEEYERWGQISPLPIEKILDAKIWDAYFSQCNKIVEAMKAAQDEADKLAPLISKYAEKIKLSGV
ncbi:MAG: HNH endonuclease [Elusimicrobiales bacterium]